MDKKVTDIVSYIGIIGLIIAFAAGTREESKFHMNQSLVIIIASFVVGIISGVGAFIPFIGWIITLVAGICSIAVFVFMILGIVSAAKGEEKPLPVIGGIKILK